MPEEGFRIRFITSPLGPRFDAWREKGAQRVEFFRGWPIYDSVEGEFWMAPRRGSLLRAILGV